MHLLFSILLLAVGACEAVYWQKLTCPYEAQHDNLQRVWCRQTSAECCSGFTFSNKTQSLDGGKLTVTQGSDSFTVAVMELSQEGVYWCGVLNSDHTIIKLADGYFHRTVVEHIWSFTRWILLPLLPMVTIFTSIYYRKSTQHICKKTKDQCDDTTASRVLTDPLYENAAELE
ncbi:CMRF35-like molecule 8 [Anabas testudineus]|uniref:CMRF35-like molecule 8 n=1 Tax=Anabas testudineus TaxID=64144 RepID=UPI000E455738|nr:CMRF35-like molecule 8 [Anabas testudineus]